MKIAVTGGIASGKSTICKYFEVRGFNVFYSDKEAKLLIENDSPIRENIIINFGELSFINGVYNSEYIRSIVFSDKTKLDLLNSIFKQKVIDKFNQKFYEKQNILFESALIFEHNQQNEFHFIIGVFCSKDEVYNRLYRRNNFSKVEINNILSKQLNPDEKMKKCDVIIDTTNGIDYKELDYIIGYLQYLNFPKWNRMNAENIYNHDWYIQTGMSIKSPHPHRHYTFKEFILQCDKKQDLYDKFVIYEKMV